MPALYPRNARQLVLVGGACKKKAILEKKLDHPSGTLGCPIDELGCFWGFRYVLAGGRAVVWLCGAKRGLKKHFQRGPTAEGAADLKKAP